MLLEFFICRYLNTLPGEAATQNDEIRHVSFQRELTVVVNYTVTCSLHTSNADLSQDCMVSAFLREFLLSKSGKVNNTMKTLSEGYKCDLNQGQIYS